MQAASRDPCLERALSGGSGAERNSGCAQICLWRNTGMMMDTCTNPCCRPFIASGPCFVGPHHRLPVARPGRQAVLRAAHRRFESCAIKPKHTVRCICANLPVTGTMLQHRSCARSTGSRQQQQRQQQACIRHRVVSVKAQQSKQTPDAGKKELGARMWRVAALALVCAGGGWAADNKRQGLSEGSRATSTSPLSRM